MASRSLRTNVFFMVRRERVAFFIGKNGGCSSKVERLPVEQDAAGALPVSHPEGGNI